MAKLWEKNYKLNTLLEEFTVGEDYLLDMNLVAADCTASLAHATMLTQVGIITQEDLVNLRAALQQLLTLHEEGQFLISRGDEDCHTAIENYLVANVGDSGKKIHTGRSRNDQIIAAMRLYARDFMLDFKHLSLELVETLLNFARENSQIPMPGRTHMQLAMPSSVGLWAGAYAEELLDDLKLLDTAYEINNHNPLGSAASYGVPLPLDRELVARLLGFSPRLQNVLYVNNSRGKMESIILDALEQLVLTLSKLAQELVLYTMPEFGYFTLPSELTTGSSIMPQKRNADGMELLRAKSASLSAYTLQIKSIIRSLPTGYNRDFQETKSPFIKGIKLARSCVQIATLSISKLQVNQEQLLKSFTPEIFATDYAIELVGQGMPFRDAYKKVGMNLNELKARSPQAALASRTYPGTTGNLNLEQATKTKADMLQLLQQEKQRISSVISELMGRELELFS